MWSRWLYTGLIVWKKWMNLVLLIYKLTEWFPKEEIYWLVSQMRRCAVSIPSNIAEWNERNTNKDFVRFLLIAKWSCAELHTQLLLSKKLWYIINSDHFDKAIVYMDEIRRMISWLKKKL